MNTRFYDINDRGAAVKEIKTYLYLISENLYQDVRRITIDEFYDLETQMAVREYQKIKGMNVSGKVDYETFKLLYSDYEMLLLDSDIPNYILSENLPFKEGDISEDVRIIHMLINELGKRYVTIPNIKNSNYFSAETTKAIYTIQRIFDMDESALFDKALYSRIKAEIRSINS